MNREIKKASFILKEKLLSLEIDNLNVSNYFKDYLKSYIDDIDSILQRYIYLISLVKEDYKNTSIIDFGGGTGIISLLAYFSGIKNIYYIDISDEIRLGAKTLAKKIGAKITNHFTASYEDLSQINIEPVNYIINYDVLEHLYNPKLAFINLKKLLAPNGKIIMASGANTYNPIINFLYRNKHKDSELIGTVNGKKMDSKLPFLVIRKNIIKKYFPNLSDKEIKKLSLLTRGYRKDDILKKIKTYQQKKILPKPVDNTNTCDPLTGNWDENMIPYFKFVNELKKSFPNVSLLPGYYPTVKKAKFVRPKGKDKNLILTFYPFLTYISQLLSPLLNILIRKLNFKIPYTLAPYYIVIAEKKNHIEKIEEIYNNWNAWNENKIKPYDLGATWTPNISCKIVYNFLESNRNYKNAVIGDFGCGSGATTLTLQKKGYDNIHPSDIINKASYLKNFKKASIDNLPYKDKYFDFAYALSVLHYSKDIKKTINEINRVLKPKSYFIATFHTKYSLFNTAMILKKFFFPKKYYHYNFITRFSIKELKSIFSKNDFEIIKIENIHPFYFLTKIIYFFEKIRKYLKIPNIFYFLEKIFSKFLPSDLKAETAYHSLFIVRKK